jgi:OmpA-OmpF porin, OOP family
MRSSRSALLVLVATIGLAAWPRAASAQQQAEGFAVDRLYLSAPGGGWFVMDALNMRGGLGGAMSLTTSYAHNPLRVSVGSDRFTVVAHEALADFGVAGTFGRFRLYINLDMPLDVSGHCNEVDGKPQCVTAGSGTTGGYQFTSPNSGQPYTPTGVNPATATDALADGRVGFDARVLGTPDGRFRLGAGAQLFIPSPNTPNSEFLSDGTFRVMGRVLIAGDVGRFTYAGQLGAHVRPRDDSPTPGGPQGSELLFGAAAGAKLRALGETAAVVIGPEVYGASAFRSLFSSNSTALEALLSARVEGTADDGRQLRVKLGVGAGIDPSFGAPEWRIVVGIEVFNHSTNRDGDAVTDSKDACPDVPGIKTRDPRTNGCPASTSDGEPHP